MGTDLRKGEPKDVAGNAGMKRKGWSPSREEIWTGFAFINRSCPPGYEPKYVPQWCSEEAKDASRSLHGCDREAPHRTSKTVGMLDLWG